MQVCSACKKPGSTLLLPGNIENKIMKETATDAWPMTWGAISRAEAATSHDRWPCSVVWPCTRDMFFDTDMKEKHGTTNQQELFLRNCTSGVDRVLSCSTPSFPTDCPLRLHEGAAGPSYKFGNLPCLL